MSEEAPVALRRVPVRMYLPSRCEGVTPRIRETRTWEPGTTQWVLQQIRRGDTFVDVGAHVGYYTLIAARVVGDEGRVFAFEPDPDNFALLRRNVTLNGFRNVVLEQRAVTAHPGSRRLYRSPKNTGDHRLAAGGEERQSIQVGAVKLDGYLRGAGRVDFVKIDTQGAEAEVVAGMRETLRANPGIRILLEFWPYGLEAMGSSGPELLKLLESCGFTVGRAEESRLAAAYTVENRRHTNLKLSRRHFEAP